MAVTNQVSKSTVKRLCGRVVLIHVKEFSAQVVVYLGGRNTHPTRYACKAMQKIHQVSQALTI